VNPLRTRHGADLALAGRDDALPCLAAMLDDDHLSELVGEALHVTRVRYKPHTSLLVAFLRTGLGRDGYGWALSTAGNVKLDGRARSSARHGGGVRLVSLPVPHTDATIAVGGIEDDWALRKNLRWLGEYGLERLGIARTPGQGLLSGTARVLRYKPERRLVLLAESPGASIVIKTAALPADEDAERAFHQRLQRHGVSVLPRLGDAGCSSHGTSASPAWGDRDLTANGNPEGARRAGEALARLHGVPVEEESGPAAQSEALRLQLEATCSMVAALMPSLETPAAKIAYRIRRQLDEAPDAGTAVQVHGDFSADQVLVSGAEIRLIDFDRARAGTPESDLGSFAAVEEISEWRGTAVTTLHTDNLIDGYAQAGGRFTPAAVDAWAALRLFANSVDPFRDRRPDWAAEMSRHLERAGELVP
jgi:thiamine kinase-like enzyme